MDSPKQEIQYNSCPGGLLEVTGTGVLHKDDIDKLCEYGERWAEQFNALSISAGITGIENGFLDDFRNVALIRGEYDTFAEELAKETGLPFLHCDIPLAEDCDEVHHERDEITLRFHADGKPDILHDVYSAGSSSGSYGGGHVVNELPEDFYVGCTVQRFAENFPERLRDRITSNEMLRRFLEAANSRK